MVPVKTQFLTHLEHSAYHSGVPSLPREARVSVAKNYTYDDGCEPCGNDTFNREPFVVMFSSKRAGALSTTFSPRLVKLA